MTQVGVESPEQLGVVAQHPPPHRLDGSWVAALRWVERDAPLGQDPGRPTAEEDEPVGEHDRLGQMVGHEQGGRTVRLDQVEEQHAQAPRGRLVERDERLVEQQQRRLDHERPGDGRPARHAEREPRGVDLGGAVEPDLVQGAPDPGRDVGRLRQDQRQILGHRAPGQEARLLEDVGEPARAVGRPHLALEVAVEAGDHVEERGLAAARRADDRHRLGGRQLEVARGRAPDAREPARARRSASCGRRRSAPPSAQVPLERLQEPHSMSCTTAMKAIA